MMWGDIVIEKLRNSETEQLFTALASLKNKEEFEAFFDDLCTVNEIKSLSQRLEIAKLLREGIPYTEIVRLTDSSTATITRVNRCLQYGSDGYTMVLDRLENKA